MHVSRYFSLNFFFGWSSLRVLGCSVSAAIIAEILAKHFFGDKPSLHDGSSILIGVLFALMCPAYLPSTMVILGSFFAVFIGKETFGGQGQYPFNVALLGQAFLHIIFSKYLFDWTFQGATLINFSNWDLFLGAGPGMMGETSSLAILIGGAFLLALRLISWEMPFIFLGTLIVCYAFFGLDVYRTLLSGSGFLAAFYFIQDPVSTPLTRRGVRLYVLGCAFLMAALSFATGYFYTFPFAVLIMNAITPWIDACIKPASLMPGNDSL